MCKTVIHFDALCVFKFRSILAIFGKQIEVMAMIPGSPVDDAVLGLYDVQLMHITDTWVSESRCVIMTSSLLPGLQVFICASEFAYCLRYSYR